MLASGADDSEWPENRFGEAILRPAYDENGKLTIKVLPPTLYNLTHPKEEDDVSQGNRHYRTLDPVDDILRRKLERTRPGVGVFSELMVYWEDPDLVNSCPDICVVFGLKRPPEEIEESFKVAKEGALPCLVFEIVSATYKSIRDKDYEFNLGHYAKAGVKELVLVEPVTKGSPKIKRLAAYHLNAGQYEKIQPDASERILLRTVGFKIHVQNSAVVIEDAKTGERFLTSWEEEEARKAAEARVGQAKAQAEQAEAQVEQAEAQVEQAERRASGEAAARQEAERRAAQMTDTLAKTLVTMLEHRGLPLSSADAERILECQDPAKLQNWLNRAFQVDSVSELWT